MSCVIGLGDGICSQQRNHAPGDRDKADHGGINHGGGGPLRPIQALNRATLSLVLSGANT
jgi:hypothetical protein